MTYQKIPGDQLTPKQLNVIRTLVEPKYGQQENVWYYNRTWWMAGERLLCFS